MTRIEAAKIKKRESRIKMAKIIGAYAILFISAFSISTAYLINKENNKIRELILNYDKTKDVYSLQQDFKGGNF